MKEGWTYKKLGEVGTFQRGKGIKRADFVETGMPCIHYGQIHTSFGVSTNRHLSSIPSELFEQSIKASHGDVIIALTSEDVEGSCKATAWLGNYDIAISSDAAIFRHNLNSIYVSYYLRSKSFFVEKSKYARGFKVTHIKTSEIAEIGIPIPPIAEQERIVAELDLLQGIIDKKKEQLKAYDQLAQSIFYTMFGDPVTNEKGWDVIQLGSKCEVSSFKRVLIEDVVDKGIPFIRGTELMSLSKGEKTPFTLFITPEHYEKVKAISGVPKIGDLLIPSINANGSIWVLNTEEPRYYKDGRVLWVHVDNNTYTSQALKYIMHNLIMSNYSSVASGATFAELKLFVLRELNTIQPPLSLQQEFAEKVEAIERQKALVQQSIEETQTMFDCTMDKYFG